MGHRRRLPNELEYRGKGTRKRTPNNHEALTTNDPFPAIYFHDNHTNTKESCFLLYVSVQDTVSDLNAGMKDETERGTRMTNRERQQDNHTMINQRDATLHILIGNK